MLCSPSCFEAEFFHFVLAGAISVFESQLTPTSRDIHYDRVRQPPPNPRGLSPEPAAPAISGTFQIPEGAQPPPKFLLSGGSPLIFDSYPSSPGGQLHRSSSGCGLPQAVMAGRKSLLSFGFSSNRAQQAASAGNSGLLPLDPAPNRGPC